MSLKGDSFCHFSSAFLMGSGRSHAFSQGNAHLNIGMQLADNQGEESLCNRWENYWRATIDSTLEFFYVGLQEVVDSSVDRHELLYNASVLAHHAQVSSHALSELPTPATLATTFDTFVLDASQTADADMMEAAGAQCLLLAGFFEDQMRRRHSIRWYARAWRGLLSPRRDPSGVRSQGAAADARSRSGSSRGGGCIQRWPAHCAISPI